MVASASGSDNAAENQLGNETSPYLLQHKDNPVHWRAWGPEAFAEADAADKPVLLSVGYAACHWCHVMAHESFENPEIAGLMNDLFVNIKVDREERPDVDQVYQQALSLLGQQGGWPLTMFLTPKGDPFWGGTYFPPSTRYGRPGFPDVLRGVAETYAQDPAKVGRNVKALGDALARLSEGKPGGAVTLPALDAVADRLVREVDPFLGGINGAPKFPQPSIFDLLWRAWLRTGQTDHRDAVITTLTHMANGGIYDHLAGGFARYSTDEQWLVPHFEKMLYDNAQLLALMTQVWQGTHDPLLEVRVRETVGWLLTEMKVPGGAFGATLDADSEGEEGRFYVWTKAEVERLLGDDADLFCAHYDVTDLGNWEGHTILNRRTPLKLDTADGVAEEGRLAHARARLLRARALRIRPAWDDKVLADWNGLMIAALARAGFVFEQPTWIEAAIDAFGMIVTSLRTTGADGLDRLFHSGRGGRARHAGLLEDYANMAKAALTLHEITGDAAFLDQAVRWSATLDHHFWDQVDGGYFITADDIGDLPIRPRHAHDNAVPAGNGTQLGNLTRLWLLTGQDRYRAQADTLMSAFSGELGRNFFPLATYLNMAELLLAGVHVVLVGEGDDLEPFNAVIRAHARPVLVVSRLAPGQNLPEPHPAAGKTMVDGRATAYVCQQMRCSLPVTTPEALADLLAPNPSAQ
ncbi:MAG: thioredoxin domain-containing protein [Azospirillaceae bacterium]|nr:thioredoxin domain-containing protein [Azospirillaceae bacterium]